MAKYIAKDPAKVRAATNRWINNNRERHNKRAREYYALHKDKINQRARVRYALRKMLKKNLV